jgi:hypothetical protein
MLSKAQSEMAAKQIKKGKLMTREGLSIGVRQRNGTQVDLIGLDYFKVFHLKLLSIFAFVNIVRVI